VRQVVVAVFPGVQALDVSGPLDVFSEANAFVAADAGYVASVASEGAEPVRASNGQRLLSDSTSRWSPAARRCRHRLSSRH
jgi:transcriptional regulator GlxA family with amidase domain